MPRSFGPACYPLYAMRLAVLALAALSGAALVHLIEYHLGGAQSLQSAADMLAQCPLGGILVLIALCAVSASLTIAQATRRLSRRRREMRAEVARSLRRNTIECVVERRRPVRLLVIACILLAAQTGTYALSEALWPMGQMMHMNGALMHVSMSMAEQGAAPLVPAQMLVALVIAVALWLLERRVTVLRAAIVLLRALLNVLRGGERRAHPPTPNERRVRRFLEGMACLPRPPPAAGFALPA